MATFGLQIKNPSGEILIDSEKSCLILHQTYVRSIASDTDHPTTLSFSLNKVFSEKPLIAVTPVNCVAVAQTESVFTPGVGYTEVKVKFLLYGHTNGETSRHIYIYVLSQGNDNADKIDDYGLITYSSNNKLSFVSNGEQLQYVNRYSALLEQHTKRDVTINRNFVSPPVIIPINWVCKTHGDIYYDENPFMLEGGTVYYSYIYNMYGIRYNAGQYNVVRLMCFEGQWNWYSPNRTKTLTVDIYSLSE